MGNGLGLTDAISRLTGGALAGQQAGAQMLQSSLGQIVQQRHANEVLRQQQQMHQESLAARAAEHDADQAAAQRQHAADLEQRYRLGGFRQAYEDDDTMRAREAADLAAERAKQPNDPTRNQRLLDRGAQRDNAQAIAQSGQVPVPGLGFSVPATTDEGRAAVGDLARGAAGTGGMGERRSTGWELDPNSVKNQPRAAPGVQFKKESALRRIQSEARNQARTATGQQLATLGQQLALVAPDTAIAKKYMADQQALLARRQRIYDDTFRLGLSQSFAFDPDEKDALGSAPPSPSWDEEDPAAAPPAGNPDAQPAVPGGLGKLTPQQIEEGLADGTISDEDFAVEQQRAASPAAQAPPQPLQASARASLQPPATALGAAPMQPRNLVDMLPNLLGMIPGYSAPPVAPDAGEALVRERVDQLPEREWRRAQALANRSPEELDNPRFDIGGAIASIRERAGEANPNELEGDLDADDVEAGQPQRPAAPAPAQREVPAPAQFPQLEPSDRGVPAFIDAAMERLRGAGDRRGLEAFSRNQSQQTEIPQAAAEGFSEIGDGQSLAAPAAQAYRAVLSDPTLSDEDRAVLGRVASAFRTRERQAQMRADYQRQRRAEGRPSGYKGPLRVGEEQYDFEPAEDSDHTRGLSLDLPRNLPPQIQAALRAQGFSQNVEGDRVHWTFQR